MRHYTAGSAAIGDATMISREGFFFADEGQIYPRMNNKLK
jgi:hypothetical protein